MDVDDATMQRVEGLREVAARGIAPARERVDRRNVRDEPREQRRPEVVLDAGRCVQPTVATCGVRAQIGARVRDGDARARPAADLDRRELEADALRAAAPVQLLRQVVSSASRRIDVARIRPRRAPRVPSGASAIARHASARGGRRRPRSANRRSSMLAGRATPPARADRRAHGTPTRGARRCLSVTRMTRDGARSGSNRSPMGCVITLAPRGRAARRARRAA